MHQQKTLLIQRQVKGAGECRQIPAVVLGKLHASDWPGHPREVAKAAGPLKVDFLGGSVVVVPPDRVRGVFPHPGDAGIRFEAVIHQIAEKQANIEFFTDGFQRGPIGVDVRDKEDSHEVNLEDNFKDDNRFVSKHPSRQPKGLTESFSGNTESVTPLPGSGWVAPASRTTTPAAR
jgi:hypothetical protein